MKTSRKRIVSISLACVMLINLPMAHSSENLTSFTFDDSNASQKSVEPNEISQTEINQAPLKTTRGKLDQSIIENNLLVSSVSFEKNNRFDKRHDYVVVSSDPDLISHLLVDNSHFRESLRKRKNIKEAKKSDEYQALIFKDDIYVSIPYSSVDFDGSRVRVKGLRTTVFTKDSFISIKNDSLLLVDQDNLENSKTSFGFTHQMINGFDWNKTADPTGNTDLYINPSTRFKMTSVNSFSRQPDGDYYSLFEFFKLSDQTDSEFHPILKPLKTGTIDAVSLEKVSSRSLSQTVEFTSDFSDETIFSIQKIIDNDGESVTAPIVRSWRKAMPKTDAFAYNYRGTNRLYPNAQQRLYARASIENLTISKDYILLAKLLQCKGSECIPVAAVNREIIPKSSKTIERFAVDLNSSGIDNSDYFKWSMELYDGTGDNKKPGRLIKSFDNNRRMLMSFNDDARNLPLNTRQSSSKSPNKYRIENPESKKEFGYVIGESPFLKISSVLSRLIISSYEAYLSDERNEAK